MRRIILIQKGLAVLLMFFLFHCSGDDKIVDNDRNNNNTPPTASFTITPVTGTVDTVFVFDASSCADNEDSATELQVRWDWENDGTWDTNWSKYKTITHQYTTIGTKMIRLEVQDSGGLTHSVTQQITVIKNNTAPTASFTVSPDTGDTETVFSFDASACSDSEDATSSLQVRWDWENDGSWETGYLTSKTRTHQYSSEGTKTIKLEVKDTEGLTNITTRQVTVESAGSEIEYGTMTDNNGYEYVTVKIGNQWWMAENLKTTKYRNGDVIYFVTDSATWGELSTAAYCYYDDIKTNSTDYGALYNWYAVNDSRNIAPAGWHVPTDDDWKELEMYLGMSQSEADDIDYRGTDEGGKLKETGTEHWNSPNTGATNESGFNARPGGYRTGSGIFNYMYGMGYSAYYWSATGSTIILNYAWYRSLICSSDEVDRNSTNKRSGFSVRLVRDN